MKLDRFGITRTGGNERGAALVEFALILPLLMMIVFGSLTAGLAYQEKQDLLQIAREGARYGATLPSGTTGWATTIPRPCGAVQPLLKGFVVIESDVELDVVAVYTAAGDSGQVQTLHMERVPPRGSTA